MPYKDREQQLAWLRDHYIKNKAQYRKNSKKRREFTKNMIRDLKNVPCADCFRIYPYYVMDFDHRAGEKKIDNVSRMFIRESVQRIIDEIEKCDVVCSNCHRVRTFLRLGQ